MSSVGWPVIRSRMMPPPMPVITPMTTATAGANPSRRVFSIASTVYNEVAIASRYRNPRSVARKRCSKKNVATAAPAATSKKSGLREPEQRLIEHQVTQCSAADRSDHAHDHESSSHPCSVERRSARP